MVHYKLTYFNIKGRAEPLRIILAYIGIPYEDHRFEKEELPKLKPDLPWGQVPVLRVDGDFVLAQTGAIARFLANRHGLSGETEWETAACDELVNAVEDLRSEWKKIVHAQARLPDPIKMAVDKKNFVETHGAAYLKRLTLAKERNGGEWLVGKSPTWADLYIAAILDATEEAVDPKLLDPFPALKKWKEDVFTLPGVKEYLARR